MALRLDWLIGAESGSLGTNTDLQSHHFCQMFTSFTTKASLRLLYVPKTTFKNRNPATHHVGHSVLANSEHVLHAYNVFLRNDSFIVLTHFENLQI